MPRIDVLEAQDIGILEDASLTKELYDIEPGNYGPVDLCSDCYDEEDCYGDVAHPCYSDLPRRCDICLVPLSIGDNNAE